MNLTDEQKEKLNNMCPVAKEVNLGGVVGTQLDHQANSVAADVAGVVADFNALLAKLQAAGIMKES